MFRHGQLAPGNTRGSATLVPTQSMENAMGDERAMKIFQLDDQISTLQSELKELTDRASAVSGAASEERLNDMIASVEAKIATLRELRDAHSSAIRT